MVDSAIREQTACMMRVRNEARWIRQSLERTWGISRSIVLWDDGSTDETISQAILSTGLSIDDFDMKFQRLLRSREPITLDTGTAEWTAKRLHILRSPFRDAPVREREAVNEIRDKNFLWSYCKARVLFTYMLCLDGDEVLSQRAIRRWPSVIEVLDSGIDIAHLTFVYLWDDLHMRRVDGLYGDIPLSQDVDGESVPRLNFPRIFTIKRVSDEQLFSMCFKWEGTKGGFHCGSIPRQDFLPEGREPKSMLLSLPVAHYGYISNELRQAKFRFYNQIDPGNTFEGEYRHIIGEPDQHAPGPVQLVPWEDV